MKFTPEYIIIYLGIGGDRVRVKKTQLPGVELSVHQVGDSLMVTLPTEFAQKFGLKKGDKIQAVTDHQLILIPGLKGE